MAASSDNSDDSRDENVQPNPVGDQEEEIEWNAANEVELLKSMLGHRPVGVSKSFHMACIMNDFSTRTDYNVSSEVIWRQLKTMYDLKALDEKDKIPFDTMIEDYEPPENILEMANELANLQKENSELENKETKSNQTEPKKEVKKTSAQMPKAEPTGEKVKSKNAEGQTKKKNVQNTGKISLPKVPAEKGIKTKALEPANKLIPADVAEAKTPEQEQKEVEGGSKTEAKESKPVGKATKSEPKSQPTKGKGRRNQKSANKGKN